MNPFFLITDKSHILATEFYKMMTLNWRNQIPGIRITNPNKIPSLCIYFTDAEPDDDYSRLSLSWYRYHEIMDWDIQYIEGLLLNDERKTVKNSDIGYSWGEIAFHSFPEIICEIVRLRNLIAIKKGLGQINHEEYLGYIHEANIPIVPTTKYTCVCFRCNENDQENFTDLEKIIEHEKRDEIQRFELAVNILQETRRFPYGSDGTSIFFKDKLAEFFISLPKKRDPVCITCENELQYANKYPPLFLE